MQGWVRFLALRRVDEQAVLSRGIIEIVEQFDSKVRLGKVRLWFPNVILLLQVTRTMGSNYSFWVCSLNSSGIQTAYDSDTLKRTMTLASSPNWSWMTSWPSGWVAKSFWISVQFRWRRSNIDVDDNETDADANDGCLATVLSSIGRQLINYSSKSRKDTK